MGVRARLTAQQESLAASESKRGVCSPTQPSASSSQVRPGEATFQSPRKEQAERCQHEAAEDKGATAAPLSFAFLRPDVARSSECARSPETKGDNAADPDQDTSKEEAARSFHALLQTPEGKRGGVGSAGRADGGGRNDQEEGVLFSLLSLRSQQSDVFGVFHDAAKLFAV